MAAVTHPPLEKVGEHYFGVVSAFRKVFRAPETQRSNGLSNKQKEQDRSFILYPKSSKTVHQPWRTVHLKSKVGSKRAILPSRGCPHPTSQAACSAQSSDTKTNQNATLVQTSLLRLPGWTDERKYGPLGFETKQETKLEARLKSFPAELQCDPASSVVSGFTRWVLYGFVPAQPDRTSPVGLHNSTSSFLELLALTTKSSPGKRLVVYGLGTYDAWTQEPARVPRSDFSIVSAILKMSHFFSKKSHFQQKMSH